MSGDIYQAAILRHARAGVGAGSLESPDATVIVDNPLCGDRITLELRLEGQLVAAVAHRVRGCVLCEAAASLIGELAVGAPSEALAGLRDLMAGLLHEQAAPPADRWAELAIFGPVAEVKSRHRCVLLPFEALAQAIAEAKRDVRWRIR